VASALDVSASTTADALYVCAYDADPMLELFRYTPSTGALVQVADVRVPGQDDAVGTLYVSGSDVDFTARGVDGRSQRRSGSDPGHGRAVTPR
jgi:hypothetical protein